MWQEGSRKELIVKHQEDEVPSIQQDMRPLPKETSLGGGMQTKAQSD